MSGGKHWLFSIRICIKEDRGRIAQITKGIMGRIYGDPETEVLITYTDEGGKKREKKITRAKRSGIPVGPEGAFFFALELKRSDWTMKSGT